MYHGTELLPGDGGNVWADRIVVRELDIGREACLVHDRWRHLPHTHTHTHTHIHTQTPV
jgi:hypothetical protein